MPARQLTDTPLAPELEAIADAAADRLRAEADPHTNNQAELQRQLAEAASAAIGAGAALGAIADAERVGQARARDELGSDALKRIARASRRRREADAEYQQEILRAGRIGLTHREIANAAELAHGTVRAILARTKTDPDQAPSTQEPLSPNGGQASHT